MVWVGVLGRITYIQTYVYTYVYDKIRKWSLNACSFLHTVTPSKSLIVFYLISKYPIDFLKPIF